MKTVRAVLLMSEQMGVLADAFARSAGLDLLSTTVSCLADLEVACARPCDLLLSFGTGVIVPGHILRSPELVALNIHAASPDYPGRDPHHFAVYDEVKEYGATIHYMIEKVDQGQIVDVQLFDVPAAISAAGLLAKANEAGIELMRRFFSRYADSGAPIPKKNISWGKRKTARSDFLELCRIDCGMSEQEFLRRLHSTAMPGFDNLYIDIHGRRFRLEGKE